MKKRSILSAMGIVLILSMVLAASVTAAGSTGTIEVSCDGVRFYGYADPSDNVELQMRLHETVDWQSPRLMDLYVPVSGNYDLFYPWVDPDGNVDGQLYRTAIVGAGIKIFGDEGVLDCPPPPDGGFCSPGYFKKHLDAWGPTGYAPGDDFDTVFGVDYFDPDITLLDAVNAKGGGVNALARTGTASLLSAAHPGVNYPLTEAEVIAAVQAGDKSLLDQYIDFDCPID